MWYNSCYAGTLEPNWEGKGKLKIGWYSTANISICCVNVLGIQRGCCENIQIEMDFE